MKRLVLSKGVAVLMLFAPFAVGTQAHVGTGITVDQRGRVYFADTVHNRIWKMERDGRPVLLAAGIHTDLLVVDDNDNLYVQNDRSSPQAVGGLLKITREGLVLPLLSPNVIGSGLDRILTLDRQGNIYFLRADREGRGKFQIFKKTPQGRVSLVARSDGSHDDPPGSPEMFTHVNSCTWSADGSLYVRDGNRIRKVAPDGSIATLADVGNAAFVGNGPLDLRRTLGLAVDAAGNVYVAHYWRRQVFRITPDGRSGTVARSRWPWVPTGVAVQGNDIYVLERIGQPYGPSTFLEVAGLANLWRNPRIRKISPDGRITILAGISEGRQVSTIVSAIFITLLVLPFVLLFVGQRRRNRRKQLELG